MPRHRKRITCLACHEVRWTMDAYRRHKAQADHRDEGFHATRVTEGDEGWQSARETTPSCEPTATLERREAYIG